MVRLDRLATVALILAAITLPAAAVFAAGAADTSAAQAELSGVDPTGATVVYWHQHSQERETGLNELIEEFNRTNEWDITVQAEYAGGYSDIYTKMFAAIAADTPPSLVVAYQNQAGAYQLEGALVDLASYVEDPTWGLPADQVADFIPGIFAQDLNAQFDGQRLGFPPNRSIEVLYYNLTWLTALGFSGPPKTWQEFEQMAVAATDRAAGTYGYAISTDASSLFAMTISRGGDFQKAGVDGYTLNTPQVADSLRLIKSLYDRGAARKIAERYGDQTDFGNAKTLFTMGSTSGLPFYAGAVESGADFEWSVAPLPTTLSKPVVDIYGASVSVPKTTPEQQLAAWLFIKWMSEPRQQARWVQVSNYFPVRFSVADDLGGYFQENPRYEAAFQILQEADTKAEPPFSSYELVRKEVDIAFNAILDGEPIDATLQALQAKADRLYRESL